MTDISLPGPPTSLPTRLTFLDGIRGLAAIGVVIHHCSAAFYPTTMTGDPATAHLPGNWEAGFAASPLHILLNFRVTFFFVLSGLVLANSAAGARRHLRAMAGRLVRRYVRLAGPVAVGATMAYILLHLRWFYNQQVAEQTQAYWFSTFWLQIPSFIQLVRAVLVSIMWRGNFIYNPVLWSMQIEWLGSVMVLVLMLLFDGRRYRLLVYTALGVGLIVARVNVYYVVFLLGLGLSDVYRRNWTRHLNVVARRTLVAVLLSLAAIGAAHPHVYYKYDVTTTAYAWMLLPGITPGYSAQLYHTLAAVALLGALLLSARLQRLFDVPLLRQVGRHAFALYLTHFLWQGSGASALFLALRPYFSYHASFGLMALASLPVLVVSTVLFYRWVDRPFHLAARWLGRLVAGPFPTAAAKSQS